MDGDVKFRNLFVSLCSKVQYVCIDLECIIRCIFFITIEARLTIKVTFQNTSNNTKVKTLILFVVFLVCLFNLLLYLYSAVHHSVLSL